jgi:hypothetical protein
MIWADMYFSAGPLAKKEGETKMNCYINNIQYYGERDNIIRLRDDLCSMLEARPDDECSLADFFAYKGINTGEISYRNEIDDIETNEHGLYLITEDYGRPMFELYDLIAELYGLEYVLEAESDDRSCCINTDIEGKFFDERYMLQIMLDGEADTPLAKTLQELSDIRYFSSFEPINQALAPFGYSTEEDMEWLKERIDAIGNALGVSFDFCKFISREEFEAMRNAR